MSNKIFLKGVLDGVEFSNENYNERFYKGIILVKRKSGFVDRVPVVLAECLNPHEFNEMNIGIYGETRSRNSDSHIITYVFVNSIWLDDGNSNEVVIDGYLCSTPKHRKTQSGKTITELLVACNRKCGKSDYLHCIAWNRNAIACKEYKIGDRVLLKGRFQSREYVKNGNILTTYEISVNDIRKE